MLQELPKFPALFESLSPKSRAALFEAYVSGRGAPLAAYGKTTVEELCTVGGGLVTQVDKIRWLPTENGVSIVKLVKSQLPGYVQSIVTKAADKIRDFRKMNATLSDMEIEALVAPRIVTLEKCLVRRWKYNYYAARLEVREGVKLPDEVADLSRQERIVFGILVGAKEQGVEAAYIQRKPSLEKNFKTLVRAKLAVKQADVYLATPLGLELAAECCEEVKKPVDSREDEEVGED